MSDYECKQVIVMRKDLNMRKGKMIAQGAHASMAVLLNLMKKYKDNTTALGKTDNWMLAAPEDGPISAWLKGRFAKIVVSVDSEADLLALYEQAKTAKLPCSLITDAGFTEFNGVPTNTCIAIGPWERTEIDKLTGHLKLL